MTNPFVVVLDYGSGNVRSAQRALERAGARTQVTADPDAVLSCDGLVVPGVGAFAACMAGLRAVGAPRLIDQRLAGDRPVLGICVGLQVMFEHGVERGVDTEGLGQWPGVVEQLHAPVLPHMGWNTIDVAPGSALLGAVRDQRLYFVHSYAVTRWVMPDDGTRIAPPAVSWSEHGQRFVAAVENGPLAAVQFHPEKSGDAGSQVLRTWVSSLT